MQTGSLATRIDADLACVSLLQVVQTNAIRLHCQSGPSAALDTGSGYASPVATPPATQANKTIAAARTTFLGVHQFGIMAVLPFRTCRNIGSRRPSLCERIHSVSAFRCDRLRRHVPAQAGRRYRSYRVPSPDIRPRHNLCAICRINSATLARQDARQGYKSRKSVARVQRLINSVGLGKARVRSVP